MSTVTIAGSDKDISRNEDSKVFDRPVTKSVTAWDTDHPSGEQLHFFQPTGHGVGYNMGSRYRRAVIDK